MFTAVVVVLMGCVRCEPSSSTRITRTAEVPPSAGKSHRPPPHETKKTPLVQHQQQPVVTGGSPADSARYTVCCIVFPNLPPFPQPLSPVPLQNAGRAVAVSPLRCALYLFYLGFASAEQLAILHPGTAAQQSVTFCRYRPNIVSCNTED